jgi:hypothetical protein
MNPVNGSAAKRNPTQRATIVNEDGKGWMFNILRWCRQAECGSHAEHLLLLILGSYSDKEAKCWPGEETLAADMGGTSPRYVRILVRRLERRGHIASRIGGGDKSNLYFLNVWGANEQATPESGFQREESGVLPPRNQESGVPRNQESSEVSKTKSPLKYPKREDPLCGNDRDSFKGPVKDTGQSDLAATGPKEDDPWHYEPPRKRAMKCPVCGEGGILEGDDHKCPGPRPRTVYAQAPDEIAF